MLNAYDTQSIHIKVQNSQKHFQIWTGFKLATVPKYDKSCKSFVKIRRILTYKLTRVNMYKSQQKKKEL